MYSQVGIFLIVNPTYITSKLFSNSGAAFKSAMGISPITSKKGSLGTYLMKHLSYLCDSQAHRPYNFSQAQRYPSGFLNRTPVFNNNTSKLHSFVNTPSSAQRQNSTVYSFLKKTSPSPQRGPQVYFHEFVHLKLKVQGSYRLWNSGKTMEF